MKIRPLLKVWQPINKQDGKDNRSSGTNAPEKWSIWWSISGGLNSYLINLHNLIAARGDNWTIGSNEVWNPFPSKLLKSSIG